MRSAPPVMVPVGGFAIGWRLPVVLAVFSALLLVWVGWTSGLSITQGLVALLIWSLTGWLSWRMEQRERLPPGELSWDGQRWQFRARQGDPAPARLAVLCDLGPAMLVEVNIQAGQCKGRRCTWLADSQMPGQWHGWRCAVFARDIL